MATCPVKVFDIEDIGNGNMIFLLCISSLTVLDTRRLLLVTFVLA